MRQTPGPQPATPAGEIFLLAESSLEKILGSIEELHPTDIVIDSIQTTFSEGLDSAPGTISQVRHVPGQLLILAKSGNIPVFLIGHVTKDGAIAGPKALEHLVDAVLYFEGERHHNHRIVRAVKNRFGAANEVGIFEMTSRGLIPVRNPSDLFLRDRESTSPGSAVTCALEGTRPILVEVQALVVGSQYGAARRTSTHRKFKLQMFIIGVRLRGVAPFLIRRRYVNSGPAPETAQSPRLITSGILRRDDVAGYLVCTRLLPAASRPASPASVTAPNNKRQAK